MSRFVQSLTCAARTANWLCHACCRYEPDTTAAIILTGEDEEAEAAAAEVCKEAEIGVVVKQSEEVDRTTYLIFGKPQDLV
jgi:hypothetical protein